MPSAYVTDFRGQFACRFCWHDLYEHNQVVGCPNCRCSGSIGEGMPQTDDEFAQGLLPAGEFAPPFEPKPEPKPRAWDALPELEPTYDDDGHPVPGTLVAGWDIAFGCRINFGPGPDGDLRVDVHVSDRARRDGVAVLPTTPAALRTLGNHLIRIAAEQEIITGTVLLTE